jgi:hypothetical protein
MMKTRNVLGGLALAAALSAGVATASFAQQSDTTTGTTGTTSPASTTNPTSPNASAAGKQVRKEFACAHQDQIKDLQSQHKALLASRLALLKEARQAAVDAHAAQAVAKIDTRIAEAVKAQGRVESRIGRFTDWAAKNCTG